LIFDSLKESIQSNYMTLEDPAELWEAIKRDHVEELQRGQFYVRRDALFARITADFPEINFDGP
jgi:hypothetical protein